MGHKEQPKYKTEYQLAISKYGATRYVPKRDLEHAQKGADDSYRDFKLYSPEYSADWSAWIETREVSKWKRQ